MDTDLPNIIRNIAQELELGCKCYLNKKTMELISVPDVDDDYDGLKEAFEEDFKRIKKEKKDLIKFKPMTSFESFKVMKRFVDAIPDRAFQSQLDKALAGRKPFQNFNRTIDDSDYRQDWFTFKSEHYERIVERKLHRKLDEN